MELALVQAAAVALVQLVPPAQPGHVAVMEVQAFLQPSLAQLSLEAAEAEAEHTAQQPAQVAQAAAEMVQLAPVPSEQPEPQILAAAEVEQEHKAAAADPQQAEQVDQAS